VRPARRPVVAGARPSARGVGGGGAVVVAPVAPGPGREPGRAGAGLL
jgi:hypothetical protein